MTLEQNGDDYSWRLPDGALVPLRGTCGFPCGLSYVPDKPVLRDLSLYAKPGQKIAFRGFHRRGKNHHHQPHQPLLRYPVRLHHLRWHRRAQHPQGRPAPLPGHRAAGHAPVHRHGAGQHPLRPPGRHRRGASPPPRSPTPTISSPTCPRVRHRPLFRRSQPLPGPAPAGGHRRAAVCPGADSGQEPPPPWTPAPRSSSARGWTA